MDPDSKLDFEMPDVLHVYKIGRVERFDGTETVLSSPDGEPANGVASKDVVLDPGASISARLYLPAGVDPGKKLPVIVFFHGGTFMVHTTASSLYHIYAASFAAAAPAVVVSVEYRLAPEQRLPAAYDDAFAALKGVIAACRADGAEVEAEPWLAAHGDAPRVVLAGDSAGGNMAHNLAEGRGHRGLRRHGQRHRLPAPVVLGEGAAGCGAHGSRLPRNLRRKVRPRPPLHQPNGVARAVEAARVRRVLVTMAEQCWFMERE